VTDGAEANWRRIVEAYDRYGVEYLIVGGVGARLHGAQRLTTDFDSLPNSDRSNLDRLASAMRELGAFLRVDGLTDDESRALPTPLDGLLLANMDISTWRTDAGDLDVLTAIPTRLGGRATYSDILDRGVLRRLRWCASARCSPRRHHRLEGMGESTEGSRGARGAAGPPGR
jgi:hypothetical protein